MLKQYALAASEILLPNERCDMTKWAVVACDQFTAQRDYWRRVQEITGSAPSALNVIFPEAWLNEGDARIAQINRMMTDYEKNVLTRRVNGFVLVERTVASGKRLGLVAAVDLEMYDYARGSTSLIRATEGTILERIPPRVRIREHAALELPHIMLLADDPERTLIEPLYAARDGLPLLYDFELMLGGGHVRGWHVADSAALEGPLATLMKRADGLLFAVGDGNHSLATARRCWLNLRDSLSPQERETHPARWALAEIINLHDPALVFEPIHRALFGADPGMLRQDFASWLAARGMALRDCGPEEAMFTFAGCGGDRPARIEGLANPLPLTALQPFLDEWLASHPEASIDYIHGEEAARALAADGATGILLPAMDKHALFESVRRGGPLPRKTFSMGEANEKRYYLEARRIRTRPGAPAAGEA